MIRITNHGRSCVNRLSFTYSTRTAVLFLFAIMMVLASCEPESLTEDAVAKEPVFVEVYGDARDGIQGVPDGEALEFWEGYGLSREMFEDPGSITDEEIELLQNAVEQAMADNWEYLKEAAEAKPENLQSRSVGERTEYIGRFGPVTVIKGVEPENGDPKEEQ